MQPLEVLLRAAPSMDVVDGVDRDAGREECLPHAARDRVEAVAVDVLEHGDRVDAVERPRLDRREPVAEPVADEAHLRARRAVLLELHGPVPGAVVRVDDPDLVAEPRQDVGDVRLARADLEHPSRLGNGRDHGFQDPGTLGILQVALRDRERAEVLPAVDVVADRRVAESRCREPAVALADSLQLQVVEPVRRQRHARTSRTYMATWSLVRSWPVLAYQRRMPSCSADCVASSQARP